MKTRHLTAATTLACALLTLTACGSNSTPSAAPQGSTAASAGSSAGSSAGASTGSAKPDAPQSSAKPTGAASGTAAKPAGADVPACAGSEGHDEVTGQLVGLDKSADPRWNGVVKLSNVSGHACVMYGPADVRTDSGASVFTKLATGVLGSGSFATDKAHGTVLQAGETVFQPVSWVSSPPTAPNASCTTGKLLVLARNEESLFVTVPVTDARFCPVKDIGSPQVMIGIPRATLAEAQAQLQKPGAR
ncbi:hypothetical protein [Kitasatospora sp. McL0602]|uniref:hypothetical protein n=1 Tax=Kitasatospora sp. McL0602 TaxID=3439530 RepID=UPI003F8980D0